MCGVQRISLLCCGHKQDKCCNKRLATVNEGGISFGPSLASSGTTFFGTELPVTIFFCIDGVLAGKSLVVETQQPATTKHLHTGPSPSLLP